jgi:hypothetical protein
MTAPIQEFNPDTAYGGSWAFVPGVRRAKLYHRSHGGENEAPYIDVRVCRVNWDQADWSPLSSALAGAPISCGWQVWASPTATDPQPNAILEVLEGPDGGTYIVAGIDRDRYGARWLFACIEDQT